MKGSIYSNNGYWWYAVRLPGEKKRKARKLCAPGSDVALHADRPRDLAITAALQIWEEATQRVPTTHVVGKTVDEVCGAWLGHCEVYYRHRDGTQTGEATLCRHAVRTLRELYGTRRCAEMQHADMLTVRDRLIAGKLSRATVNAYVGRMKLMWTWAMDEGLVTATQKAELTQLRRLRAFRTEAREPAPVTAVDDDVVERTCRQLAQNTADMVRVHRLTGMRPGEVCAMSWEDIDTGRTPWVYRPREHKNDWRMKDRAVLIGPKARAILKKYRRFPRPFSPFAAIEVEMRRKESGKSYSSVPNEPRERWTTAQYLAAVKRAALRAGFEKGWAVNRLRHTFATSVRRSHGLVAAGALLGHEDRLRVTNIYSFEAAVDDLIREFGSVVEAIG